MSDYYPDAWTIVKVGKATPPHYRVMAQWYGGYTGSDSWKMSSGVTSIHLSEQSDDIEFHNVSGSVYHCHPNAEKMPMYLHSIFNSYKEVNDLEIVDWDELDESLFIKV